MLKWTVKKRFADTPQQFEGEQDEVRSIKSRRSLGDVLENTTKLANYRKRRSLGSHLADRVKIDKENHFVTPVRRKSSRQSSTPLSDCGNLQPVIKPENLGKRKHHMISSEASPQISPISLNFFVEPSPALFPQAYACTLPTFDVEYSPVMKETKIFYNSSPIQELPPKRLKMNLLEVSYEFKPESASTSSPLSTPLVTRKAANTPKLPLELSSFSESSLNSSEVGDMTLQKMIDDILASAKTGKKFKKCFARTPARNRDRNANFMLSDVCENFEEKSIEKLLSPEKIAQADKTIIIADIAVSNEREVKSPTDETCTLKRQNAVRRKNGSNENKNKKKMEDSQRTDKDFHDSSIQKCLSFSSANFEDLNEKSKRSSVASNASSCSSSYVMQSKFCKNLMMKGSLEMEISTDEEKKKIVIHVIRCKNLERPKESPQINAYVKCALVSMNKQPIDYQRTAVQKNSSCPNFDHKFVFDINDFSDYAKYVQIAVWHRNRNLKRSEFLGCLMVPVKIAIRKNITGSFLLQPQLSLNNPSPLIPDAGLMNNTLNHENN